MKAEVAPVASKADFWPRALAGHDRVTTLPLAAWAIIALLNFGSQIVLRRNLVPGEFGTCNAALGALNVMIVPLLAFTHAVAHFGEAPGDAIARDETRKAMIRSARLLATETLTWIWALCSSFLLFALLFLIGIPRFSEQFFAFLTLLMAIGGIMSWTLCQTQNRLRLWAGLAVAAALARLVTGAALASQEPWAESGLAALFLAGFITLAPAMRARESDWLARWQACRAVLNRDFLLYTAAALSVLLGLSLFANADRIAAQHGFGIPRDTNLGSVVDFDAFDAYQTAALLSRALLWGTQPLLWIWFSDRVKLSRTTPATLTFFWIYLAAVAIGIVVLSISSQPLCDLFCGHHLAALHNLTTAQLAATFVPSLALAMLPLALLQALGIFSLASRRYPECFTLGGCSLAYALILFLFGRQPGTMIACMFGTGVVSLMAVLFIGVARWGRKQP
jgi:hypothetical protein